MLGGKSCLHRRQSRCEGFPLLVLAQGTRRLKRIYLRADDIAEGGKLLAVKLLKSAEAAHAAHIGNAEASIALRPARIFLKTAVVLLDDGHQNILPQLRMHAQQGRQLPPPEIVQQMRHLLRGPQAFFLRRPQASRFRRRSGLLSPPLLLSRTSRLFRFLAASGFFRGGGGLLSPPLRLGLARRFLGSLARSLLGGQALFFFLPPAFGFEAFLFHQLYFR